MITEEMIARINVLAKKSKAEGLTDEEKVEQQELRRAYIDSFKKQGCWLDLKILFGTVVKVFKKSDIYETKKEESMTDEEAAKNAEAEIIRIAHLPDEEVIE